MAGKPENQIFDLDVYQDMLHKDLFKVKMTFNEKQEMISFMKSDNYATISGSFKALGMMRDQHMETFSDLKEKAE